MANNQKHNGCFRCGSKEQEFLTSVSPVGKLKGQNGQELSGITGAAICDKCLKEVEYHGK